MVYGPPSGSCLMVYSPFSFVIDPVVKPVDSFFTCTVAPITPNSVSSITIPVITARSSCANMYPGISSRIRSINACLILVVIILVKSLKFDATKVKQLYYIGVTDV